MLSFFYTNQETGLEEAVVNQASANPKFPRFSFIAFRSHVVFETKTSRLFSANSAAPD